MTDSSDRLAVLLGRLDAIWARTDVELRDRLAPGCSAQQLAALEEEMGLRLPPEARTWWFWHSGPADASSRVTLGATVRFEVLSLESAAGRYRELMEASEALAEFRGDEFGWRPSWLPILGLQNTVGIDCADPSAPRAPLHEGGSDGSIELAFAPSLTDVVAWWIELYEAGVYRWTGEGWVTDEVHPLADRYRRAL